MADNETIAEIIAEMRALSNPISDGIIAINGRSIADRLEAAHKREVREAVTDCNQFSDAAKLREVCIYALAELEHFRKCNDSRLHICDIVHVGNAKHALKAALSATATAKKSSAVGDCAKLREALSDACYAMFNFLKAQNGGYEEIANALDKAKAALASPPRNCDIVPIEAQEAADMFHRERPCHGYCYETHEWLLAPATEKEVGNDGNE